MKILGTVKLSGERLAEIYLDDNDEIKIKFLKNLNLKELETCQKALKRKVILSAAKKMASEMNMSWLGPIPGEKSKTILRGAWISPKGVKHLIRFELMTMGGKKGIGYSISEADKLNPVESLALMIIIKEKRKKLEEKYL